jgi:hypothetical protein
MSNSLYGRLFKYRERKARTPLENFLTEALADLINRLPKDELDDFVASLLLDADAAEAWRDLTARGQVKISCRTQFPITSGSILDILFVADDATPLLVIENKVPARDSAAGGSPAPSPSPSLRWPALPRRHPLRQRARPVFRRNRVRMQPRPDRSNAQMQKQRMIV